MKKTILILLFAIAAATVNAQTPAQNPEDLSNQAIENGNAKAESGDWMSALNLYNNAIQYYGKNAMAYYKRGLARQNLHDYRNAIMDFSKAIYLNNADGASYYGRGICYNFLGKKQQCCLDLTKATEYGYNDAYQAIQNLCN